MFKSGWAKPNEIKNDKDVEKVIIKEQTSEAGGMPLINDGKHTLSFGFSFFPCKLYKN